MEKYFELQGQQGKMIRGVLNTPDRQANSYPLLLICYGFNGTRVDYHRILTRFARRLATEGWSCVRFDYSGLGVSDGFFHEACIKTKVADVCTLLDFFAAQEFVSTISLMGFSDGAQVSLLACQQYECIENLLFWSPIIADTNYAFGGRIRFEKEPTSHTYVYKLLGLWVNREVSLEQREFDYKQQLCEILEQKKLSCCFGQVDTRIAETYAFLQEVGATSHRNYREIWLDEGDHCFCRYDVSNRLMDQSIQMLNAMNETSRKTI